MHLVCILFAGHAVFDDVYPLIWWVLGRRRRLLLAMRHWVLVDDDDLTDMVGAHHSSVSFSSLAMQHPTLLSNVPIDMVGAWLAVSSLAGHAAPSAVELCSSTDMVGVHHSSVPFSLLAMRHLALVSDVYPLIWWVLITCPCHIIIYC